MLVAVLEIVLKIATVSRAIHAAMIVLFLHTVRAAHFRAAGVVQCRQRRLSLRRAVSQLPQHARAQRRACSRGRRREGDSQLPKVVSVKSSQLTPEALLQLAANAESCSNSRTARAICAAYSGPILTQYLSRAVDIPESGVEVYIESTALRRHA